MLKYMGWRLVQALTSLLFLVTSIFFLGRLTGDPIARLVPVQADAEQINAIRALYGLNDSLWKQYWLFLRGLPSGNFGESVVYRQPVSDLVAGRIGNTIQLIVAAAAIGLMVALPLGVYSAVYQGRLVDKISRLVAITGIAAPVFVTGLLLIRFFAVDWPIFPTGGQGDLTSLVLPAISLGWILSAALTRLIRSSMIEVLETDYVKLARLLGVPEYSVIWKHALRNALIPVVGFGSAILAAAIGGAVVVEQVFAWPGLGTLVVSSITQRDFPVLQGAILVLGLFVVTINLGADLLIGVLNPRGRS